MKNLFQSQQKTMIGGSVITPTLLPLSGENKTTDKTDQALSLAKSEPNINDHS